MYDNIYKRYFKNGLAIGAVPPKKYIIIRKVKFKWKKPTIRQKLSRWIYKMMQ